MVRSNRFPHPLAARLAQYDERDNAHERHCVSTARDRTAFCGSALWEALHNGDIHAALGASRLIWPHIFFAVARSAQIDDRRDEHSPQDLTPKPAYCELGAAVGTAC